MALYIRKPIFLVLAAAAALTACSPRSGRASPSGSPAASRTADAIPAVSRDDLRGRLQAAGFGVPTEPMTADDFALASLAGGTVKLSDHRGKVVFLNFWATWCPPCRAEMPSMQALYEKLGKQGLVILAVDLQEPAGTVREFIEENGYDFPVLLDSDGAIGAAWGAQSIPTTYLIDRDGGILARHIGARAWDDEATLDLFAEILAVK